MARKKANSRKKKSPANGVGKKTAPAVVNQTPAEEKAAPIVEETAPVAEKTEVTAAEPAPVEEKTAPAAEEAAPAVEKMETPATEPAPVEEKTAPAAEETTPVAEKTETVVKKRTSTRKKAAPAAKKAESSPKKTTSTKKKAAPIVEEPAPVVEETTTINVMSDLPRRSVAFIGSECHPFVKTGGLGDVMYALPRELVRLNCDVRVILPRYACIPQQYQDKMVYRGEFYMDLGKTGREYYVGIMEYICDGVVYDFIDNQEFFSSGNPYLNLVDDIPKYCFFSKSALSALNFMNWIPDIIGRRPLCRYICAPCSKILRWGTPGPFSPSTTSASKASTTFPPFNTGLACPTLCSTWER